MTQNYFKIQGMDILLTLIVGTILLGSFSWAMWLFILRQETIDVGGFKLFNFKDEDRSPDLFESIVTHYGCALFAAGLITIVFH